MIDQQTRGLRVAAANPAAELMKLCIAASDSKHFWSFTDNIYRFNPILLRKTPDENELQRFHGYNERIATAALAKQVAFYRSFHARCCGAS